MGFLDFLLVESPMKSASKAAVVPASSRKPAAESRLIKGGEFVDYYLPTTPAKRKAAVDRLLRHMPPAVKRGEKPAHVLLAEERAGV